jgi:hypothetical protein
MAPIGCESQGVIVRSWVAYSGRDSPRGASSGRADGRRPPRRRFARDHVSRSALRRCARKWPRPFPLAHRVASGGLGAAQGTVRDSSAFRTNRLACRSLPALWHRCLRYRHRGTIARDGSTNPPSESPLKVAATRACGGRALSSLKVVTTPNAFSATSVCLAAAGRRPATRGFAHEYPFRLRLVPLQEIAATATAIAVSELNGQAPCSVGDMVTAGVAPSRKRVGFQRLDRPT